MPTALTAPCLGMNLKTLPDLPTLTFWSPENVIPGLVWLLLFGIWWAAPGRRAPARMLLAWGLLNLVGGFATVLPLPVWPFRPEQSPRHYAFHLLYALMQFPLLLL